MGSEILAIIAFLGGWSVLVGGIAAWLGKLLALRASIHWQTQQQKQIENLRNELSRSQSIMNSAIMSFASGQEIAQSKKLEAISVLWESVLEVRDSHSKIIMLYKILHPTEYQQIAKNNKVGSIAGDLDDETVRTLSENSRILEGHRPYFGETLWILFFIYRAFLGRVWFLTVQGKKKGEIADWRKDSGVRQLLSYVLSQEEIEAITGKEIGGIHEAVTILEGKILQEMSFIVSGQHSSSESFDRAKEIAKVLSDPEAIADTVKDTRTGY